MVPRGADAVLVVAFLNTLDVESGTDDVATQEAWERWVAEHDLAPAGQVADAVAARAALRAAAGDGPPIEVEVPVSAGVVDGRPATVPADAAGAVLLAASRLADAGAWARVKLCAAETCRWAYVDESRNRSRAWCSMETCGNRAKARSFRARARAHSDPTGPLLPS
ncbi:MAG: CGNR zinc finger domain-containing protein [Ilumatobacteraceae bacterium]